MGWRNRPTFVDYHPSNSNYVMFVDENGDNQLQYIQGCISKGVEPDVCNRLFTVTGCIVHKDELKTIRDEITNLKNKYWNNGLYLYKNKSKRICLHSREIRRKEGPFNEKLIDYNKFMIDLSNLLENINATIISITVDKYKLCKIYNCPYDPYKLSSNFLIERYALFLIERKSRGIIVLEKRGKKEDEELLNHLKLSLDFGTGDGYQTFIDSSKYNSVIKGIYFNPKWDKGCNEKKTYFGLEIADLFSYPIHKYWRTNKKDKSFEIIEKKLRKYPYYRGCGLKIFPK